MSETAAKLINWDRPMLKRFKKAYASTEDLADDHVFVFEGNQYVRAYARYLIEFLEGELGK